MSEQQGTNAESGTPASVGLIDYVRCPRADANTCPQGCWMVQAKRFEGGSCDCPTPENLWSAACSCGWTSYPNEDRGYVRRVARMHGRHSHKPGTWRTRSMRTDRLHSGTSGEAS